MAPLLFPVTLIIVQVFNIIVGGLRGYLFGLGVYWIICLTVSIHILYRTCPFFDLYRIRSKNFTLTGMISVIVTFIPVILTFAVAFLKTYQYITTAILLLLIIISITNGFIEELFWRGTYFAAFAGKDAKWAYIFPTIFFTLWHVSLSLYRGIHYEGGYVMPVVGALGMGALWAWGVSRQKSILFPTIAHILTNFFAFSQFIIDN